MRTAIAAAVITTLAAGILATAQMVPSPPEQSPAGEKAGVVVRGHAFMPEQLPFTQERMAGLKLPEGFTINAFATDVGHARMLAVGDDGTVYVTRPKQNDVLALRDTDNDGKADQKQTVVQDLDAVHGITLHDGKMYLATPKELYVAEMKPDGTVEKPRELINDLPDGGQHPNRTLAFGPDGKTLFITVGSSCNACIEPNEEHATILTTDAQGKNRKIFARGLRNTIGFGWHPTTEVMWGMDHGTDWLGDDTPPEELNKLAEGNHYGWPWKYGDNKLNQIFLEHHDKEKMPGKTTGSVLEYQAHSAPIGWTFYTGDAFPADYRNDAFVAMRGSWNRRPATGYKVVRVKFDPQGNPEGFEDFATGWLTQDGKAHFGRLAGVAQARDGALLVSDDTNGVIYRIAHKAPQNVTRE